MAVFLLTGDDETLLVNAALDLVRQLVGTGDRSLMVDDFDAETDGFEIRVVIDAVQTMPFLTDKRVVVLRNCSKVDADAVTQLVAYLQDPLPTTDLVMLGGGRLAKALTDALKAAGASTIATAAPARAKERVGWIDEQLAGAGVALDASAKAAVTNWLGEDPGRLAAVLETLRATYPRGKRLTANEVTPFLGNAGDVPPWDLTDAIDGGDVSKSLSLLKRMMHAGERHPLQIMAVLHGHYQKMLMLDGSGVRGENAAAELLGVKSTFQASKALKQSDRLGSANVHRALQLLATADLDLRGQRDLDAELVAEVLVARLTRLVAGRR